MSKINQEFDLTGKVILVTGAAGFLGEYFVKALMEAEATVVMTDLNEKRLAERAASLTGDQDKLFYYQLDVTDSESIERVVASVVEKYKKIDVVVNAAAIDPKFESKTAQNKMTFIDYPEEAMQQSIDVNLLGPWRVCKAVLPQMLKQEEGNIVNVASIYGVVPPRPEIYPKGTEKPVDYPMTKAALIMMTRYISSLYGRAGIRANVLALGGVERGHDEEFKRNYGAQTSLGRMVDPKEIGGSLVYLASEASRGMTGEVLMIDGGFRSR